MKEILGLLFFVCVTAVTIHLSATKQIEWKLTLVFLVLGLAGGFAIARFDGAKRSVGEPGAELVAALKQKLTEEWKREAGETAGANATITAELDSLRLNLETQKKTLEDLGKRMGEREAKFEIEAVKARDSLARADERAAARERTTEGIEATARSAQAAAERGESRVLAVEGRLAELTGLLRETALIQSKVTWLQASAKEPGLTLRAKAAQEEIDRELFRILEIAIPDRAERNLWAQRLIGSLPK